MKALCWMGSSKVEVHNVSDPTILNPHDAIIKITRTAICGSDLHLYDGFIPTMEEGDILGHEFMGIVEETGKDVTNLQRGDRVMVPFTIACGNCEFCKKQIWSACDNTNPNAHLMEAVYGYSGSGLFGYSHMMGGYAGGQAQYVRVPFANVGPLKIESDLPDEKVLFLSDIFPTGYMAAENAQIQENDTVAVWGCGPVGQFAIASAFMLGAARVIAIDRLPERLEMARSIGAITVDYSEEDVSVLTALKDLTGGIGPDSCIDAVGLEAHSAQLQGIYDKVKTAIMLETDRPSVLRQAIQSVRKGGTVSIPGVYGGLLDKVPFGAAFGKGITMKMGQTNMHKLRLQLVGVGGAPAVDCICFPEEEQPSFGFPIEMEIASKVLCPVHGLKFTSLSHLYVAKRFRDQLWTDLQTHHSEQFRKAWFARFPPALWPAEEEATELGTIFLKLKDGSRILACEPALS